MPTTLVQRTNRVEFRDVAAKLREISRSVPDPLDDDPIEVGPTDARDQMPWSICRIWDHVNPHDDVWRMLNDAAICAEDLAYYRDGAPR